MIDMPFSMKNTAVVFLLFCLSPTVHAEVTSANLDFDVNQFIETINTVKTSYAKNISDKKLLEDAIRGMVNNLDPHSEYLDEDAYKALMLSTSGEFGGLGIEVTTQYNVLKIITPMVGTPAAKAGIKPSDYIVAINHKLVSDLSPEAAIKEMRGDKGSHVLLTIIRAKSPTPLNFDLVRDTIRIDSLTSKMLEDNVGYIRINQFQEQTVKLLKTALKELNTSAKNSLRGLILDLRNNPGGLLESAVGVVNLFIESDHEKRFKQLVVYTQGRIPDAEYRGYVTGHDTLQGAPLIVLINEGSASASEIVAGALQDYHRAIIVGGTSFGKGSVQTILSLDDTHAVKLTTALYLTPAGRIIQNQGIVPDIFLSRLKLQTPKELAVMSPWQLYEMKSASIPHLPAKSVDHKLAQEDFQLFEAHLFLKSLSQLQNQKSLSSYFSALDGYQKPMQTVPPA
jgi:carboxyl-terminal processing protease